MFIERMYQQMVSKYVIILMPTLLLSACGSGLEGIYSCDGQLELEFEFKSDGTGYVSRDGMKKAIEYTIDGANAVITGAGDSSVLTIKEDSLVGDKFLIGSCTKN